MMNVLTSVFLISLPSLDTVSFIIRWLGSENLGTSDGASSSTGYFKRRFLSYYGRMSFLCWYTSAYRAILGFLTYYGIGP